MSRKWRGAYSAVDDGLLEQSSQTRCRRGKGWVTGVWPTQLPQNQGPA